LRQILFLLGPNQVTLGLREVDREVQGCPTASITYSKWLLSVAVSTKEVSRRPLALLSGLLSIPSVGTVVPFSITPARQNIRLLRLKLPNDDNALISKLSELSELAWGY
jgi:hypothetical protein